jgi:hypothetical protein
LGRTDEHESEKAQPPAQAKEVFERKSGAADLDA